MEYAVRNYERSIQEAREFIGRNDRVWRDWGRRMELGVILRPRSLGRRTNLSTQSGASVELSWKY